MKEQKLKILNELKIEWSKFPFEEKLNEIREKINEINKIKKEI